MMRNLLLLTLTVTISPVLSTKDVFYRLQRYFKKPILFPIQDLEPKMYSCCSLPLGGRGICIPLNECPLMRKLIYKRIVKHVEISCGWIKSIPLVCCPTDAKRKTTRKNSIFEVCRPKYNFKECGSPIMYKDDLKRIYSMNETAEQFKKEGFTVVPTEVDVDKIVSFRVFNKSHVIRPPQEYIHEAVGGENARRVVTSYLALLGKKEHRIRWHCGGVIINREWILSAAHCFLEIMSDGNIDLLKKETAVVRLGEYDSSNDDITSDEFPIDFGIKEVIFHPQYDYHSVYHDLALVKLDKSIPYHRPDMSPICLPWEKEANRNLVGIQVTLTGWGSVVANGLLSPKPQEVNVTVFDTSICDMSYSTLGDYQSKFPEGIASDKMMCAGDVEGGKDACMGDSGGPIVYQDRSSKYTLAGIVSSGHGCGLSTHPGIYIPINKPNYLSWIKEIAFNE